MQHVDTKIFIEELPQYLQIHATAVKRLSEVKGVPFVGLQLAETNELGFEDYFYPPYFFYNHHATPEYQKCWWIDKFNGNLRIGVFTRSDAKELKYYNPDLTLRAHLHKDPDNIDSPND